SVVPDDVLAAPNDWTTVADALAKFSGACEAPESRRAPSATNVDPAAAFPMRPRSRAGLIPDLALEGGADRTQVVSRCQLSPARDSPPGCQRPVTRTRHHAAKLWISLPAGNGARGSPRAPASRGLYKNRPS